MTGVQTCALPICFPVTIRQAGGISVQGAPGCLGRAQESKGDIEQEKQAGREVDGEFKGGGGWKKLQSHGCRDLHASEQRHQNDPPIPPLPELRHRILWSDFEILGVHFCVGRARSCETNTYQKTPKKETIFKVGGAMENIYKCLIVRLIPSFLIELLR